MINNFNYCPLVWHHCSKENTNKVEKIQERSLHTIFSDYKSGYQLLLEKSGKELLYVGRIKKIALFVFQCLNKDNPPYLHDLFDSNHVGYSLRNTHGGTKIVQPKVNTTKFGLNSLRYCGSLIWNKLPPELRSCVDINQFKMLLKSWSGPNCSCGSCVICKKFPLPR